MYGDDDDDDDDDDIRISCRNAGGSGKSSRYKWMVK